VVWKQGSAQGRPQLYCYDCSRHLPKPPPTLNKRITWIRLGFQNIAKKYKNMNHVDSDEQTDTIIGYLERSLEKDEEATRALLLPMAPGDEELRA